MTVKQRCLLSSYIYQHTCSFAALSIPPLLPLISSELSLTAANAGLLMFMVYLSTALTAPASGYFTDRVAMKFLVVFSVGLLSLGLVLLSAARDFLTLLAIALMMGVGYSVSGPLSTKMVASVFEQEMRATALGIKQTGTSSGSALASLILPSIAVVAHRHSAFIAAAGIAAAAIPIIILTYVNTINPEKAQSERYMLGAMSRGDTILFQLGSFGLGFCMFAMIAHLPLFLTADVGFSIVEAGFMLALTQFFSVLGRVGLGVLADRFFSRKRTAVLSLASIIAAVSSTVFILSVRSQTFIAAVSLAFIGFFLFGSIGVVFTIGSELFNSERVGTTSGMTYFFLALGNSFGPLVFGQLIDALGYSTAWQLYVLAVCLCAFAFIFPLISHVKPGRLFSPQL
ncbi:MAG: MFS transporter [Candidatus Caldarchaeum sp.]|uniref:MFS transporter n=1 Tax=Caldiarchaeum subterraneum TaxID=311458 RepID=A0A7C5LF58_CALS0